MMCEGGRVRGGGLREARWEIRGDNCTQLQLALRHEVILRIPNNTIACVLIEKVDPFLRKNGYSDIFHDTFFVRQSL